MLDVRYVDLSSQQMYALERGDRRTLLIIPFILFRKASQLNLWYSALVLSFAASACIALNLAGGMYAPPVLVPSILVNSARAAASLSCSDTPTLATVPFPLALALGTASPSGRLGETDRRRLLGGEGDRSLGTGVIDLDMSDVVMDARDYAYRFLFGGPSGLSLRDAARRGEGERDADGERGIVSVSQSVTWYSVDAACREYEQSAVEWCSQSRSIGKHCELEVGIFNQSDPRLPGNIYKVN